MTDSAYRRISPVSVPGLSAALTLCAALACFTVDAAAQQKGPEYSALEVRPFDVTKDPEIDHFIAGWRESMPVATHGSLVERAIFTQSTGDVMRPATRGAVLTELKRFSHASLAPRASTAPVTLEGEQEIFYIDGGAGTITAGKKTAELRDGVGVLMPPGVTFTMTCTSDVPLTMYVMVEAVPEGFKPRRDMLVHDERVIPFHTTSGHWTHMSKRLFTPEDGLATLVGMGPVWFAPMTMGQPHSHSPGVEEIWFSLSEGVRILLGKEMRELPPGWAYKIPPNSATPHSTINATDTTIKTFWLMKNAPHTPEPYSQLDPKPYDPATEPNIDMFTGSFHDSPPRHTHGCLIERDILTKCEGDPLRPARKGAVLNYFNRFTHATLMPYNVTAPVTLRGEQELYFVLSGEGTVTGGGKTQAIRTDSTFLVPECLEFTMACTGDEPLTMYLVSEPTPAGFRPNDYILVRDEASTPLHTSTAHWVNCNKYLIEAKEGLAETQLYLTVYISPNTFAQPHSHDPGCDEIWCTVSGDVKFLLGKQIRDFPPGTAYMIPPDTKTPHANFNVTDKPAKIFYFARFNDHEPRK